MLDPERHTTGQPNNLQRRQNTRLLRKQTPIEVQNLDSVLAENEVTVNRRNQILVVEKKQVAEAVYSQDHDDLVMFVNSKFSTSKAIEQASKYLPSREVTRLRNYDIYTHMVRGTSMAEISQMPMPLSETNIRVINKLLKYGYISNLFSSKMDRQAQEMAIALPALAIHQTRNINISSGLKPLSDRLINYFGYYANFLTDLHIDDGQEYALEKTFGFVGGFFRRGLYIFLPGYLGISSASSVKLMAEKAVTGNFTYSDIVWRKIKGECAETLNKCCPAGNLPPELVQCQQYSPESDLQISRALNLYYRKAFDVRELPGDQSQMFKDLNQYQGDLRSKILRTNEKFLRFHPRHSLIKEVLVASPRKGTLMFVLHFDQSQSSLTLEVNSANRFFGIPVEMYQENIHVGDLLAKDLLPSVLAVVKRSHPQSIPDRVIKISPQPEKILSVPEKNGMDNGEVLEIDSSDMIETPKRRSLPKLFEPCLPQPIAKIELSPIRVEYSRQAIIDSCSQRLSQKQLDQIVKAITIFEYGGSKPVSIKGRPNLIRLKVGDRRIILEIEKGNPEQKTYIFRNVEGRSQVYKKLFRF